MIICIHLLWSKIWFGRWKTCNVVTT